MIDLFAGLPVLKLGTSFLSRCMASCMYHCRTLQLFCSRKQRPDIRLSICRETKAAPFLIQGKLRSAIEDCHQALERGPDARVLLRLMMCQLGCGMPHAALATAHRQIEPVRKDLSVKEVAVFNSKVEECEACIRTTERLWTQLRSCTDAKAAHNVEVSAAAQIRPGGANSHLRLLAAAAALRARRWDAAAQHLAVAAGSLDPCIAAQACWLAVDMWYMQGRFGASTDGAPDGTNAAEAITSCLACLKAWHERIEKQPDVEEDWSPQWVSLPSIAEAEAMREAIRGAEAARARGNEAQKSSRFVAAADAYTAALVAAAEVGAPEFVARLHSNRAAALVVRHFVLHARDGTA